MKTKIIVIERHRVKHKHHFIAKGNILHQDLMIKPNTHTIHIEIKLKTKLKVENQEVILTLNLILTTREIKYSKRPVRRKEDQGKS